MVTNRQINRDKLHLIAGIPTLKNMSQIESSSQLLGKIWQPCSTSPTRQNIGYYKFPLFSLMPINDHHPTIGTMISMIGSSNYWIYIYIYHHPTIGYIHPTIYNDHPLYIYGKPTISGSYPMNNSCSKPPTNPTAPRQRPALLVPIEVKGSSNWSISKSWNDAFGWRKCNRWKWWFEPLNNGFNQQNWWFNYETIRVKQENMWI